MKKEDLLKLENKYLQAGMNRVKFEQEVSFAWQAYNANQLIQKCTPESILASVYNVALTNLSLNPILKHAVLLPRWNNKDQRYECCLEPQYQGLIDLAIKSGTVKAIIANVVYEGDDLEMDYAVNRKVIKHIPYIVTGKDHGNIKAVYSIAILSDGTELGEVMSWREIEDIRERSESYKAYKNGKIKSTIWITDTAEMAKKTVVKRQIKYLSKDKAVELMQAVELDNQVNGFREFADSGQIEFLTQLIEEELRVDDNTLQALRLKLNNVTFRDEASELIDHILFNYNQPDQNLGQREIGKLVDEKVNFENT